MGKDLGFNKMKNMPLDDTIPTTLRQIQELYRNHFEQNQYTMYIDRFPLDSSDYQDIRHTLNLINPKYKDIPMINWGISLLETYIRCFKEIVLPGISQSSRTLNFNRRPYSLDNDVQLRMKMVAYVLPRNIKRMNELIEELKENLPIPTKPNRQHREFH